MEVWNKMPHNYMRQKNMYNKRLRDFMVCMKMILIRICWFIHHLDVMCIPFYVISISARGQNNFFVILLTPKL